MRSAMWMESMEQDGDRIIRRMKYVVALQRTSRGIQIAIARARGQG